MKRDSQFKRSQTAVSTTERYFTLSVVCLRLECTRRQRKGNSKKYSDSCRTAWLKWIETSVLQLLLIQREAEGLFIIIEKEREDYN